MATTLPNITLQPNVWTDLNTASGIEVGTAMLIQNLGPNVVQICRKATKPDQSDGFNIIQKNDESLSWISIGPDEPRIWARSTTINTVNVQ